MPANATSAKPPLRILSLFLLVGMLPALLLTLVFWRFSELTGSLLIFSQGLLLLAVVIFVSLILVDSAGKWRFSLQFFNGFLILLLSGFLLNQSYIHWQESKTVITGQALPVIWLGFGGLWVLTRLLISRELNSGIALPRPSGGQLLALLSGGMAVAVLIVHWTGWVWLDTVLAAGMALLVGLVAAGFTLDAYWHLLEQPEE
ncbi:MAG: hypothetical protein KDC54_19015 [Lewinella sp.]|nr:hypothetical protein [Lewinella sp.]